MGANVQQFTVQCVLVINIFNEKIFVFLWFWYITLMFLTACSIVYWVIIMTFPCFSRWFVSRHLELSEMPFDPQGSAKDVERFVSGYLKVDGVFIVRMINSHAGIIFGTDLVLSLWRAFYGIEENYRRQKSTELTPSVKSAEASSASPEKQDNKLNFLRMRTTRPSAPPKSAASINKELQESLIPESVRINAAIMMHGQQSEDDVDAENKSDEESSKARDQSDRSSEDSAHFQQSSTLARGKSLERDRLLERNSPQRPPPPPLPVKRGYSSPGNNQNSPKKTIV